jgi:uncharacterized membrane protein YvbJ
MSYFCHDCGTVIEEDTDTLCGRCQRTTDHPSLPRRKYYAAIGRHKARLNVKIKRMMKFIKKSAIYFYGRVR